MNKKQVYITIAIAIILSFFSFILLYTQSAFLRLQNNIIGKPLFSNFTDYEIKMIKIIKPSGRIITLKKNKDAEWVVANCFDYPVDPQKINTFLRELSSMKIIQNVYADESELSELGLLPPKSKDKNSGSEIIISDDAGNVVFSMIIGAKRTDMIGGNQISRGRYVYKPDIKHVFLVEESLDEVNYRSRTWLNNKFVNIKNIKTVKLLKSDKEVWFITRPDIDSKFVPGGKKADDDYNTENINRIISSLENLKFETVANPSLTDTYTGLTSPYIVKVESFDNQSWQICIGNQASDTCYVRIEHTSSSNNTKADSNPGKKWTYLVTQNRITPLVQPAKGLLKKDKKTPGLTNKMYSSPMS